MDRDKDRASKRSIYFDNASTSSPKAEGLGQVIAAYFEAGGYNIGRGHYPGAEETALGVLGARKSLARYFNFPNFRNVIFTNNITHSLNLVLKGLLRPGDEVITSSVEHNAVMRPLYQLATKGVKLQVADCQETGQLDPARVEALISPQTRALVFTGASNVSGTALPLVDLGEIARRRGIFYVIDAAQIAGHLPLDTQAFQADAFCFTGHKGLKGPQGIGGVLLSDELASVMDPLIAGGTGSFSDSEEMPPHLPDRFEAGTLNLPGILGLGYAVNLLLKQEDPFASYEHEMQLTQAFLQGVEDTWPLDQVKALGLGLEACQASLDLLGQARRAGLAKLRELPPRFPVVSLDFLSQDNAEITFALENDYGIMTRTGLHCAPRAHQTFGSFPEASVRFSFGPKNTQEEVEYCLQALQKICPCQAI